LFVIFAFERLAGLLAPRKQAWVTGFFIVELGARAYYYSILHDIKAFVKNPLNLIDLLCILTDLVVFVAFADSGEFHIFRPRFLFLPLSALGELTRYLSRANFTLLQMIPGSMLVPSTFFVSRAS